MNDESVPPTCAPQKSGTPRVRHTALPIRDQSEIFLPRLFLASGECFANSVRDDFGERGICFKGGLLCLQDQDVRQIDGRSYTSKHII
jgi:hypothetical protein